MASQTFSSAIMKDTFLKALSMAPITGSIKLGLFTRAPLDGLGSGLMGGSITFFAR